MTINLILRESSRSICNVIRKRRLRVSFYCRRLDRLKKKTEKYTNTHWQGKETRNFLKIMSESYSLAFGRCFHIKPNFFRLVMS